MVSRVRLASTTALTACLAWYMRLIGSSAPMEIPASSGAQNIDAEVSNTNSTLFLICTFRISIGSMPPMMAVWAVWSPLVSSTTPQPSPARSTRVQSDRRLVLMAFPSCTPPSRATLVSSMAAPYSPPWSSPSRLSRSPIGSQLSKFAPWGPWPTWSLRFS